MSIDKAIEEAQEFIKLAQEYKQDFYNKKHIGYGCQYKMKLRAQMKRQSMNLTDALVLVRKHSAYDREA